MPLSTGTTVKVSLPVGVPDKPIPRVYTFPLADILVGVALDKVADPPLMDNAKSLASKAPLASVVSKTASLNVTAIEPLFSARFTSEIVGTAWSITIALFAASEFSSPGVGKVNTALFPAASFMVPLLRASADVL